MARIAGVNIPNHQHAVIALQAIYGVGRARAGAICDAVGIEKSKKIKDGYSPEYVLRKCHLCALLDIRRHIIFFFFE